MKLKILSKVALTLALFSTLESPPRAQADSAPDGKRFKEVLTQYTDQAKRLDAFYAPHFDLEELYDQLGDYPSPQYFERAHNLVKNTQEQLASLHRENLSPNDQITFDLLKSSVEVELASEAFPFKYLTFNQMDNRLHSIIDDSNPALTGFPFDSTKHYEAFAKRLSQVPQFLDRLTAFLNEGIEKKITNSCEIAPVVVKTYEEALVKSGIESPFLRPLKHFPKSIPDEQQKQIRIKFETAVAAINPALEKFHAYYQTKYLPNCSKRFGIFPLPEAKAMYAHAIKRSTLLDLSAQTIHETGLAEVARIEAEMAQIKDQLHFNGTLKQFVAHLLESPDSYFKSGTEMFEAFQTSKVKVAKVIPQYFSKLPTHDYKIVSTSNSEDAAGRYMIPTENLPFGRFVANTLNVKSVAKWEAATLLMHEAVPGHHFQLALQFEMKDSLPEFRRKLFMSNAFVEGWALYSEFLGKEMGIFEDPMERFGHLNEEMLRAVRLVVDSGMHAYGWDRKKVIEYMTAHLASEEKDISNEANRYSVWPGQALGYKIGQLKIKELRKLAENQLGKKFDLRDFHRVVIGSGSISLPVLETLVKQWISEKLRS